MDLAKQLGEALSKNKGTEGAPANTEDVNKKIVEAAKTAAVKVELASGKEERTEGVVVKPKEEVSKEDLELKSKLEEEERIKAASAGSPPAAETKETPAKEEKIDNSSLSEEKIEELFSQQLAKKTEGKYKSVEELIESTKTQQPDFANEYVKKMNELAKAGVEFNEEFWNLQSKDFSKLTPEQIHLEAMRLKPEYRGYSTEELILELDDKYKREEWSDNAEEMDNREKLARKRFDRDAEAERQELINRQQATSLKPKAPTEAQVQAAQKAALDEKIKWEKYVDEEIVSKVSKLSTLIDEKNNDKFEFEIPDADRKQIAEVVKQMRTNVDAFWNLFKNDRGEYDFKEIYETLLLKQKRNDIIKLVAQNYKAKGAEDEVRRIKNINFKTDGSSQTKKESPDDKNKKALAKAILGR